MKEVTGIILAILHTSIVVYNILGIPYICYFSKNKISMLNFYIMFNIFIMIQWILLDGECALSIIEYYCQSKPASGPHSSVNKHPEIYWISGIVLTLIAIVIRHKINHKKYA